MGVPGSKQLDNNDLKFIVEKETLQFGSIRIYKMLEKPYEYLMRKTYRGLINDPTITRKYDFYRTMEEDKNAVPIQFIKLIEKENPCGKELELSIFCKYYYFSLADAIESKIRKNFPFSEEEIIYITETLIHLHQRFHRTTTQYMGFFKTNLLFLTTQGFLKIYPSIMAWSSEENPLRQQSSISKTNSSEVSINLEDKTGTQDILPCLSSRDDLKDIGISLLEILTLSKFQDFRDAMGNPNTKFIKFVLDSAGNKTLGMFRNLLKGLIQWNWSAQQAQKELQKIIQINRAKKAFCIRLSSAQNSQTDITDRGEIWQELKKSKLSQIDKKSLVAGRIRSLTNTRISTQSKQ